LFDHCSTGDSVFGFTLFGAYTTRLLVPASQVRCIPQLKSAELLKSPTSRTPRASETQSSGHSSLSKVSIAGFPAVAATALHAIALACAYPNKIVTRNKAALVHSAAGGVGSMLVQMCKLRGFSPVIAIVGAIDKVEVCKSLGADVVIAKKAFKGNSWWHEVRKHAPDGCAAIFDANGVETLHDSYANLDRCGRLVLYGFHTNMPASTSYLAPWHWLSMIFKMAKMPAFDPMDLVLNSKTVAGFNLSFFADERELIAVYMKQLVDWLAEGQIKPAATKVFQMHEIAEAHALIQSGRSTGKIVMQCPQ
jgi:NADPH:quinone reductase-like Zn-dependent oxidoreductase